MKGKLPPKSFDTDGCSGFLSFIWQMIFRREPPWENCCIDHDKAYWRGGELSLRFEADNKLMQDVAAKGHPYWAILMFLAVRLGGQWWLPVPSLKKVGGKWKLSFDSVRWGYGFVYPRYK